MHRASGNLTSISLPFNVFCNGTLAVDVASSKHDDEVGCRHMRDASKPSTGLDWSVVRVVAVFLNPTDTLSCINKDLVSEQGTFHKEGGTLNCGAGGGILTSDEPPLFYFSIVWANSIIPPAAPQKQRGQSSRGRTRHMTV